MLKSLWRGWLRVAKTIGHVQSLVILTVVYFVVIAPFALAIRFVSKPLGLRGAPSWHWLPRTKESTASLSLMKQQF